MAIDNETKIRHLESRIKDEELAAYFESVKIMPPAELSAEIKTIKRAKILDDIAKLNDELEKL